MKLSLQIAGVLQLLLALAHFGLPATKWMLEVGAFFLRTETELILKSRWVVPGRLTAGGFQFRFLHFRAALEDLKTVTR